MQISGNFDVSGNSQHRIMNNGEFKRQGSMTGTLSYDTSVKPVNEKSEIYVKGDASGNVYSNGGSISQANIYRSANGMPYGSHNVNVMVSNSGAGTGAIVNVNTASTTTTTTTVAPDTDNTISSYDYVRENTANNEVDFNDYGASNSDVGVTDYDAFSTSTTSAPTTLDMDYGSLGTVDVYDTNDYNNDVMNTDYTSDYVNSTSIVDTNVNDFTASGSANFNAAGTNNGFDASGSADFNVDNSNNGFDATGSANFNVDNSYNSFDASGSADFNVDSSNNGFDATGSADFNVDSSNNGFDASGSANFNVDTNNNGFDASGSADFNVDNSNNGFDATGSTDFNVDTYSNGFDPIESVDYNFDDSDGISSGFDARGATTFSVDEAVASEFDVISSTSPPPNSSSKLYSDYMNSNVEAVRELSSIARQHGLGLPLTIRLRTKQKVGQPIQTHHRSTLSLSSSGQYGIPQLSSGYKIVKAPLLHKYSDVIKSPDEIYSSGTDGLSLNINVNAASDTGSKFHASGSAGFSAQRNTNNGGFNLGGSASVTATGTGQYNSQDQFSGNSNGFYDIPIENARSFSRFHGKTIANRPDPNNIGQKIANINTKEQRIERRPSRLSSRTAPSTGSRTSAVRTSPTINRRQNVVQSRTRSRPSSTTRPNTNRVNNNERSMLDFLANFAEAHRQSNLRSSPRTNQGRSTGSISSSQTRRNRPSNRQYSSLRNPSRRSSLSRKENTNVARASLRYRYKDSVPTRNV